MRVKITYSVEAEHFPDEIGAMLSRVATGLSHAAESLRSVEGGFKHQQTAEENGEAAMTAGAVVDRARKNLADLDHRLADCMQLLSGYYQFVLDPPPTPVAEDRALPDPEEVFEETEVAAEEVLSELQDEFENLMSIASQEAADEGV